MLTYFQAIVFGVLQGVTELFPISSLGHSVLLPRILGWHIDQKAPFFLTFLVATHAATALVLFFYFWNDWKQILLGMIRSFQKREIEKNDSYAKLGWLLVVGTVPAGILGLLFEEALKNLFAAPLLVAGILFLNGFMLLGADALQKRRKEEKEKGSDERLAKLSWIQSIKIGILQCIALFPGFSRTGATMTGGLLVGLSHEDAARFSFLLATPIIGAAAVLKLPELLTVQSEKIAFGPILVGAVCAGIFAYVSVKLLTKYFETKKLFPFGLYCCTIGILCLLFFLLH